MFYRDKLQKSSKHKYSTLYCFDFLHIHRHLQRQKLEKGKEGWRKEGKKSKQMKKIQRKESSEEGISSGDYNSFNNRTWMSLFIFHIEGKWFMFLLCTHLIKMGRSRLIPEKMKGEKNRRKFHMWFSTLKWLSCAPRHFWYQLSLRPCLYFFSYSHMVVRLFLQEISYLTER